MAAIVFVIIFSIEMLLLSWLYKIKLYILFLYPWIYYNGSKGT